MIVLLFSYSALAIIIKDTFHASGLNVSEVANDCQLQVARYVVDELSLCNSYDTWHGKCIACVVMHIYMYMFTSCFTQSQHHIRAT